MASRFGTRSASRSPSYSPFSEATDPSAEHKWNSFEIRTLICLIIKGAHCDRKGPVDPMDFADQLNKALNPVKTTTQGVKALFDRDIPVNDVQRMLRRILAKKGHAVEIIQRDPAAAITKRQINIFMRQLDFDGRAESDWLGDPRREKVMLERAEMRRRLDKRKEGRPMSQERWKDNQERLRDIQSPRAQRLLSNWSMGRTFFEGEVFQHCGQWTQADRPSRATDPEQATDPPTRGRSPDRRDRSASPGRGSPASPGEIVNTSDIYDNGAGMVEGHDNPFVAHVNRSNSGTSAWDNSLTAHTPAWGTPRNSHLAVTPNPPAGGWGGGWGGGFTQPAPTPQMNGVHGGGHGHLATPSMYGRSKTPADNYGYGGVQGAASSSARSTAPTPAYGGAYAISGAASPLQLGPIKTPSYGDHHGSGLIKSQPLEKPVFRNHGFGRSNDSDKFDCSERE